MEFKTVIIEGQRTANGRLYPKGTMQAFKDRLQSDIESKKCFVTLGHVDYTDLCIEHGEIAGLVTSFKIEDGRGILEIEPLATFAGNALLILEKCVNKNFDLFVDFNIQARFDDTNTMDLFEFYIDGLSIIKVESIHELSFEVTLE